MASAFWYLEDGRCFSKRWNWMSYLIKLINEEIKTIDGAKHFADYLDHIIPDNEDEANGYGGFIRKSINEDVMINIDLREFTLENRTFFWRGAQKALQKLIITDKEENKENIYLLKILLDMHKRIKQGEDPELLNHLVSTKPYSGERKGPGWE